VSAATRVIAACAGLTLAILLLLLSAFAPEARVLQAAACGVVAVVFLALCFAAVDSRRQDSHEQAARARAEQRAAGNAPVEVDAVEPPGLPEESETFDTPTG